MALYGRASAPLCGQITSLLFGFQRSRRIHIGLLPRHAPVAQLIERNAFAGDGADDVRAGLDDAEVTVEIFDDGEAVAASFKSVHPFSSPALSCERTQSETAQRFPEQLGAPVS
ncbi:hypothetical protein AGR9A_Cc200057 [Agrobacterium salinitolerans str. Hayward 0363]|nr:hypothetical protein AGR9A_Cc200057 [Agrobacterium salinitolerans str. Hayward 0363]